MAHVKLNQIYYYSWSFVQYEFYNRKRFHCINTCISIWRSWIESSSLPDEHYLKNNNSNILNSTNAQNISFVKYCFWYL